LQRLLRVGRRVADVHVLLLAISVALLLPVPAAAQTLATYDAFSTTHIDASRWVGVEYGVRYGSLATGWRNVRESPLTRHAAFSVVNTDVRRVLLGGQLQLRLVTSGGTHSTSQAPGLGRLILRSRQDALRDTLTRLEAAVTVMAADAQPCRSTGNSRARAQLFAEITTGSRAIFATLALQRTSFDSDRIVAVLSQCLDYYCTTAADLDWVVFTRSWIIGVAHTLALVHQTTSNRVLFSVTGGGVAAETRALSYTPPAEQWWVGRRFELRVENQPATCPATSTAPAERVDVTMDARFDSVRINATAAP
jgi:hypothetical protein